METDLATTSPPLVHWKLETKYRDIADGNISVNFDDDNLFDVGNQVPRYSGWKRRQSKNSLKNSCATLESKYRDIADSKQVY